MIAPRLFPIDLPELKWAEFAAEGFSIPVCGVIYHAGQAVCGLPLGGIGTGCLDLNTDGTLGRCSVFNSFVPPRELNAPFLALAVGQKVWALSTRPVRGTDRAQEIFYWGHYPVADLEFKTNTAIDVGLRAWSPFIPGDSAVSNTPGVIFEVRLHNAGDEVESGTIAFAFPGPTNNESGAQTYQRRELNSSVRGVSVTTEKGVGYALGVLGEIVPRVGGMLSQDKDNWSQIGGQLPGTPASDPGSTIAVDFTLTPEENRIIRFVLTWYHPRWVGTEYRHYLHAYSVRFSGPEAVAEFLGREHEALLQRTLGWQEEIYGETDLPAWLRDQMVNILHTIAKDSFWASNSIPSEDWCVPNGIFGLTESPRSVPHVAIPSDWYGSLPFVFFFPDLMASLLRAYAHYQLPNGEIPLGLGWGADLGSPIYHFLHTVNSAVYVDLVGRLWERNRDPNILREFYPSVKKAIEYTKTLDRDDDGLLDLEPEPTGNQFYGAWKWHGTSAHTNGFWLPILKLAERMAEAMKDRVFANRCQQWNECGLRALEEKLWRGKSYLLYRDTVKEQESDTILANQLAGQWLSYLHDLPPMFSQTRAEIVLKTVKELHFPKSQWGLYNALRPDGTIDETGSTHSTAAFAGENICVAMTYIYCGKRATGEDLARRVMENLVLRQGVEWDMPNQVNPETGQLVFGTDFYQMMIVWGLPLALAGQDISEACKPLSLVNRILRHAAGGNTNSNFVATLGGGATRRPLA